MSDAIVIMGVAGCGKSSLGAALAGLQQRPLVEGDEYHSAASLAKMRQGLPLTDADRAGWLEILAHHLRGAAGVVLTCSALKRSYRERLRAAAPGLRFVFLDVPREEALARVAARAATHFFSAGLVESQFATLEPPTGEPGVLRLDALAPPAQLLADVVAWLPAQELQ